MSGELEGETVVWFSREGASMGKPWLLANDGAEYRAERFEADGSMSGRFVTEGDQALSGGPRAVIVVRGTLRFW